MFAKGDNKIGDHDHVTGKHRGSAHCNINFKLTVEITLIFRNLRPSDSHLIMKEIGNSDVKKSVIQNWLEKCMTFTIRKSLVFIASMHFMNSIPDVLIKNLTEMDLEYL